MPPSARQSRLFSAFQPDEHLPRIKSFAPAVRTQLMEAVQRTLDYVLTARTPDLVGPLAGQVASLKKQSETDRAGLIERVAYSQAGFTA